MSNSLEYRRRAFARMRAARRAKSQEEKDTNISAARGLKLLADNEAWLEGKKNPQAVKENP